MIQAYKKRRNISFTVFIILLIAIYAIALNDTASENISGFMLITYVLAMNIWAISYFYGCYCWAKAKGFRWHVGIGFSLLSFIGICILWSLKDKTGEAAQLPNEAKNSAS